MEEKKGIFDILDQVIKDFASAIPNLVGAIFVLFIGWIIAKIIAKGFTKVLEKIGLDKLASRINDIDFMRSSNLNIVPSKLLPVIIYYILLLITAMVATEVLQMPIITKMMADLIAFIPKLIAGFILFIFGIVLADFLKTLTLTACNSMGIPSGKVMSNFIFYLVFLTLTITALEQASIETSLLSTNLTILIAGLVGAFSIGYGLASKDTMSNYLASFYTKNKVKIGDVVRVSNVTGEVIMIDGSSLTIQTEDRLVIIPLKKLTSENLEILSN